MFGEDLKVEQNKELEALKLRNERLEQIALNQSVTLTNLSQESSTKGKAGEIGELRVRPKEPKPPP